MNGTFIPDLPQGARACAIGLGSTVAALALGFGLAVTAATARADVLSTPGMAGPLSANPDPTAFEAGLLGKIFVTGQATVMAMAQSSRSTSPFPGNSGSLFDITNGQIEVQTTTGLAQFFIQLGAYALPSIGAPYVPAGRTTTETFGPAPVAYLKLVPSNQFSIQIGSLPTLIGAESTFTFQNMNVERGLLWSQEPATSRGAQLNYSDGPVQLSASWNDGFYAGHFTSVSGLASYAIDGENTLALAGGTNLAPIDASNYATPLAQDNSSLVNLIYTYSAGALTINPYLQYTQVGADRHLGLMTSASTVGGAVLAKYSFTPEFSLAARAEYIHAKSGGCPAAAPCDRTNLLYGPRSAAASYTLTPTYQTGVFFARGEVSVAQITAFDPGQGFGASGRGAVQTRWLIETGVLF